ncbi:MAG TPA: hypothetical protein VLG11_02060 [Candidatus Saccharimonadales bacterium]|nr:hypothetical protein [Candidatus Saccharimonadales bacterium]
MSEQTTGSQFVAPQEIGVLEAEQTTRTMQEPSVTSESELILPLVAAEQGVNTVLETPAIATGEQSVGDSWLSARAKRVAAALTLISVVGAGAAACGESSPQHASAAPVGTSAPAPLTVTGTPTVKRVTPPTVESIDPSAIRPTVGVPECGYADSPTGAPSTDENVADIMESVQRQDVADLLQSSVQDIHPCSEPIIITAINDGKIITSEEFKQQSTGDVVAIWASLDAQDANGYSQEANALARDIGGGKAFGTRITADKPGEYSIATFNGAVAAYADPDNPERISHEEGVISYKDSASGVTYDLRVAIDDGQRATDNLSDHISLPNLDKALIAWLPNTLFHLKNN